MSWQPNKGRQPVKDDTLVLTRLVGFETSTGLHPCKAQHRVWSLNAPTPIAEWSRA